MKDMQKIQRLVGGICDRDLNYVDSYVSDDVGIFIPSVGFCGYAVQKGHTHPTYSFVIFLTANSGIIDAPPLASSIQHYAAAILPPDVPHEEAMGEEFVRYIAIMLSAELTEKIYRRYHVMPYCLPAWYSFLVPKQIMLLIDRFMGEYETARADNAVLESLGYLIANDLIKSAANINDINITSVNNTMQGVIDHIQQNFARSLTVSDLAGFSGMSVSAFARQFKAETGKSPAAYILKIRLEKAKKLMHSKEIRLTDIALACGFSSSAHLTSCFKRSFRMTPSEYRSLYTNV